MKSKTLIEKQTKVKTNSELVETILEAKKHEAWLPIAAILSGPARKRASVNLDKIDAETKEGDVVVVPGKVLSQGSINKKVKVVALGFSELAKEKLLNAKCETETMLNEIKKNASSKGVKIIKWK